MIIFKSIRKKFNDIVKVKLSGKGIYLVTSVKYPGVTLNQHLTLNQKIC